jgi:8-oxo-dGTP pyrophosphatase MutT (NUDIX family)
MKRGAAVVVWRRTEAGVEFLLLHRSHFESEFAGDWAWGPPGGLCEGDETAAACAARELREETGLETQCVETFRGDEASRNVVAEFRLFRSEVDSDAGVVLSSEHDAYRWLPLDEARSLCRPAYVGDGFLCVAAAIGEHQHRSKPHQDGVANEQEP